uniref:Uncharacterized protein n=1 Tax=Rhizophora mucronata TaxID=61149 RepID=A0A2P2PWR5_RHIMU
MALGLMKLHLPVCCRRVDTEDWSRRARSTLCQ